MPAGRRRWLKRSVITACVIVVGAAVAGWLLLDDPGWYQIDSSWTPQRQLAADNAERKAQLTSEWARLAAIPPQDRDRALAEPSGPPPASAPSNTHTVTFTQDELNAFFQKWDQWYDWKRRYEQYLTDPAIVLRPGRLILAGRMKDLPAVASFHFRPALDESGALRLRLLQVQAGRLPMPDAVWNEQRQTIVAALESRLPAWQGQARLSSGGSANADAVKAASARLVLQMLDHRSGEPVLFIPDGDGRAMPVRIVDLGVQNGALSLTVQSMDAVQRQALIERLRSGDATGGR